MSVAIDYGVSIATAVALVSAGTGAWMAIKSRQTRRSWRAGQSADRVVCDIARRDGNQSPAALVSRARAALDSGDVLTALAEARRARDRNDDFVNALPSMTGKAPLRAMVYHPAIYEVMLEALARCTATGVLTGGEVGQVALAEWSAADNDWAKTRSSGENVFWRLFLSDYLQLCAAAYLKAPAPDKAGLTIDVVRVVLSAVNDVPSGGLTAAGARAYQELQQAVGDGQARVGPPMGGSRPEDYRRFPSGELIDQEQIDRWLDSDRVSVAGGPALVLPNYETSRPRLLRPATTSLQELHALSLKQVVRAQREPDAWWDAVDIALYRWELLPSYDAEATRWVRDIVYDTWAAADGGEVETGGPLWGWNNFVDLFSYCYERVVALRPSIDKNRPTDIIDADGNENFFADFLFRALNYAGDVQRVHAFEFRLYKTLCGNHRYGLTAAQLARLRILEAKYGPCA